MKTVSQHIVFFVTAMLFAASTVCGIIDDKTIDHSVLNYAQKHECYATNCPVCGSQYQAQFDTQHLQKFIALASDELCAMLSFFYTNSCVQQDSFCTEFAHDTSPDSDCSYQPFLVPLRI